MVRIRKGAQEDMVAVHALIMELALYEREPNAVIISVDDLKRHGFSEQRFHCFVAEHKKSGIVGMALYYSRYSTWKGPTLHLEDLYVKPKFRKGGLGKELILLFLLPGLTSLLDRFWRQRLPEEPV